MLNPALVRLFLLSLLLGSVIAFGGCGQKGDLYLPDKYQEYRR